MVENGKYKVLDTVSKWKKEFSLLLKILTMQKQDESSEKEFWEWKVT